MPSSRDLLVDLYNAFNAHDADGAVSAMHPDVVWDGELEGLVKGRADVREYLARQWKMVDTRAQPIDYSIGSDGRATVRVRLSARDFDGNMLIDKESEHVFELIDGLIKRFDVRPKGGA